MGDYRYYQQGGDLAFSNAARLLETAQQAASNKNYGIANSLTILAAEEAIKAFLCYEIQHYPQIKLVEFKELFTDHKLKHKHIVQMLSHTYAFLNEIESKIQTIRRTLAALIKSQGIKLTTEQEQALIKLVDEMARIAKADFPYTPEEIGKWWDQANNEKNNGLYVGYRPNGWYDPQSTKKGKFEKSLRYTETIVQYAYAFKGINSIYEITGIKKANNNHDN